MNATQRIEELEAENARLRGLVTAFFTGSVPTGSDTGIDGIVMAQWGRKRLAQRQVNRTAVLLQPAS